MNNGRKTLGILAFTARMIGSVLERWPLALVVLFFLSPEGPHLRWEGTYRGSYSHRTYISCTYLGSRGFVTPPYGYLDGCPVIAWLDAGDVAR